MQVSDTSALTLKTETFDVFSHHSLCIENICGKDMLMLVICMEIGMGLNALFFNCPFSYYIRCMARQLQLAPMATSIGMVIPIHQFFFPSDLTFRVNIHGTSCRCYNELQAS